MFGLIGCGKTEIHADISETFTSGIEMENYWKFYTCDTYGFGVALPEELLENELTQNGKMITSSSDDYTFYVKDRPFANKTWDYLTEDYIEGANDTEYGQYLFEKDYYDGYKLKTYDGKVLVAYAAVFDEESQLFGYKIYVSNKETKKACEIGFTQFINNTNLTSFYNYYADTANTFIESFYLLDYEDKVDETKINEYSKLRTSIFKELDQMIFNNKNVAEKINNGEDITFEEYVAFLEYWGTHEKDAIDYAYAAGYSPSEMEN